MDIKDHTPEHEEPEKTGIVTSEKPRRARIITAALIVLVVIIAIVIAFFSKQIEQGLSSNNNAVTNRGTTQNDGNKTVTQEEEDIASVVSKVSPSVVSVLTKSQEASRFGTTEQEGAGTGNYRR